MDGHVIKSVLSDKGANNSTKEKIFKLVIKDLVKNQKWKLIIIL